MRENLYDDDEDGFGITSESDFGVGPSDVTTSMAHSLTHSLARSLIGRQTDRHTNTHTHTHKRHFYTEVKQAH